MKNKFLPVFSLDWNGLLDQLKTIEGNYGVLAPITCNNNLLKKVRELNKPFFIDSDVFKSNTIPWYAQIHCQFTDRRWMREFRLADEQQLRHSIRSYLERCDRFSPDYVFAPDVYGEPLLSLYLARLSWEEYWDRSRAYTLIGVVQVGEPLYNWNQKSVPQLDSFPPHYKDAKSFLAPLVSEYRNLGYESIALGGLLKIDRNKNTGLTFGLSISEFDRLLAWSRPDFVLGGLALTRLEILRKHGVWADSTGWLWWNELYDRKRFKGWNALQEVATGALNCNLN